MTEQHRNALAAATPTSVAVSGNLVYVLNNGTPNIAGFQIDDGQLVALEGSARSLSAGDADPAQVSFSLDSRTLVVTERGTDSISTYAIDEHGYATGPTTICSAGRSRAMARWSQSERSRESPRPSPGLLRAERTLSPDETRAVLPCAV